MFTAVTSLLLVLVALALLGGAHFLVHGVARHFAARALGVKGTRLVLEIGDREAYAASPRWRRILAAAAGPVANYLLCALCFLMAALLSGREESTLTLQRVMKGSPAEAAGLRGGDRIVAVDGRPITAFEQIGEAVRARGAGELVVEVERAGERLRFPVSTREGRIGVMAATERRSAELAEAVPAAALEPARFLHRKLVGSQRRTFTGPIGIARTATRPDGRETAATFIALLASYASLAWPLSIAVAFFANRAGRRRA